MDAAVLDIALATMVVAAKLAAPVLLTALSVGFVVSLFQSVTQIQEVTLSFVPKAIAVGIMLLLSGNWMLATLVEFTTELYARIPGLIGT